MSDFDLVNAFDRRITAELDRQSDDNPTMSKYEAIIASSKEKTAQLAEINEANEAAKSSLAYYVSGGDPQGAIGTAVNLGATAVDMVGTLAGQITALPARMRNAHDEQRVSPEQYAAYAKKLKGTATKQDQALLNQKQDNYSNQNLGVPEDTPQDTSQYANELTAEQRIARMDSTRQYILDAKKAAEWNLADRTRQNRLMGAINKTYEDHKDQVGQGVDTLIKDKNLAGLVDVFGGSGKMLASALVDVGSNPIAALETITSQIPQIAMAMAGPVGLTGQALSNFGYGGQYYEMGIDKYRKEHGGAYPPEDQRRVMANYALSITAAEYLGEAAIIKGIPSKNLAEGIAAKAGAEITKRSFKDALKSTAKTTKDGLLGEGGTEAWQTHAEGEASLEPKSGKEIFTGGVLGAVAGGGISGGGRAIAEVTGNTPEQVEKKVRQLEERANFAKAIEANDYAPYLNQESDSYAPEKAVQVLYSHANREGVTDEVKASNLELAKGILQDLDTKHSEANEAAVFMAKSQEDKQKEIDATKATRDTLAPDNEAGIAIYDKAIADMEALLPEADALAIKAKRAETLGLRRQLALADKVVTDFAKRSVPTLTPAEVKQEITAISEPIAPDADVATVLEDKQQRVKKMFSLAMASSDQLSPEDLQVLIKDEYKLLSDDQKTYLRELSTADQIRNQAQNVSLVNKDVLFGSEDGSKKGIRNYRNDFGSALLTDNKNKAKNAIEELDTFYTSHSDKASIVTAELKKAQKSGTTDAVQVIKPEGGNWQVNTGEALSEERMKAGGFATIHRGSGKLVKAINAEVEALSSTKRELESAFSLHFQSSVAPATASAVTASSTTATPPSNASTASANTALSSTPVTEQADNANEVGKASAVAPTSVAVEVVNTTTSPDVQSAPSPAPINNLPEKNVEDGARVNTEEVRNSLDQDTEYLRNPPAEHTTSVTQNIVAKAKQQQQAITTEINQIKSKEDLTEDEQIRVDDLSDLESRLGYLVQQGETSIEGDASLEEFEGDTAETVDTNKVYASKEEAAVVRDKFADTHRLQKTKEGYRIREKTAKEKARAPALKKAKITEKEFDDAGFSEFSQETQEIAEESVLEALNAEQDQAYLDALYEYEREQGRPDATTETESAQDGDTAQDTGGYQSAGESTKSRTNESNQSYTKTRQVKNSDGIERPKAVGAGKLVVFATEVLPGLAFKARNLIAHHFTQSAGKKLSSSLRPLVEVKDFLTSWVNGTTDVGLFLKDHLDGYELTPEQTKVLDLFKTKAVEWKGIFDAQVVEGKKITSANKDMKSDPKDPAYRYNDMIQFLLNHAVDANGNKLDKVFLEENVTTAMSFAMFKFIAENGGKYGTNTKEAIVKILNKDPDYEPTIEEWRQFGKIGTIENLIRSGLGRDVISALGLQLNKNGSEELMSKLESALGTHVLKAMDTLKVTERPYVTGEVMSTFTQRNEKPEAKYHFIKIARDKDGNTNDLVNEINTANKGTKGILNNLFSVESSLKRPSNRPIRVTQEKTKGSRFLVPKLLSMAISREHKTPYFLKQGHLKVMQQISSNLALSIAGKEEITDSTQAMLRVGIEAKNDGLGREYDNYLEYVSTMLDKNEPMYLEYSVWKQQRVGIATNMVNPQTSKLHRFLMTREAWRSVVDINNAESYDNYRLRIMEGFGVKTEKNKNDVTLSKYDETINTEEVKAAIKVLQNTLLTSEAMSAADEAIVLAAVNQGGSNFHTFDALMALATEATAREQNKTTFETELMGEIDGVTNGPMLSHFLFGAAENPTLLLKLLNKGGFYEIGSTHDGFSSYRSTVGNEDLYETNTHAVVTDIQKVIRDFPQTEKYFNAIYTFTGTIFADGKVTSDGRNVIKTPLTGLIFGSSLQTAVNNMAEAFLGSLYHKLGNIKSEEELATVIESLNLLLERGGNRFNPETTTIQELVDHEFSIADLQTIKETFILHMGTSVEDTLKKNFGDFLEASRAINKAADLTFSLYQAVETAVRDQFIQELIQAEKKEAGSGIGFTTNKKGEDVALQELNAEQEENLRERLAKIEPVVQTMFSNESKQSSAGLFMGKVRRRLGTRSTFRGRTNLNTGFTDPLTGRISYSMETNGLSSEEQAPGTRMVSQPVHSLDSYISHIAGMLGSILNIHDAHGSGLKSFLQTGKNLNQATWDALFGYSPMTEVGNSLEAVLKGIADMVEAGTLPPQAQKNIQQVLEKIAAKESRGKDVAVTSKDVASLILGNIRKAAKKADTIKFEVLVQLKLIDQYALEGGAFVITPELRDAARKKLAEIKKQRTWTKENQQQVDVLNSLIDSKATTQTTEATTAEAPLYPSNASVLSLKDGRVMQLLDHAMRSPDFSEETQSTLEGLMNKMWGDKGISFKEALKSLPMEQQADVVNGLSAVQDSLSPEQWGKLAKVRENRHEQALVNFFEKRPVTDAATVIKQLRHMYSQPGERRLKGFHLALLSAIEKLIDPKFEIRYITPSTSKLLASNVMERTRGQYNPDSDSIYVMSPEFAHSGVTADMLLHELTHAILFWAVENQLDKQNAAKLRGGVHKSATNALVAELQTLLDKATEFVQDEKNRKTFGSADTYDEAIKNVHEMLTWGMTNEGFRTDVLEKISMKSKNKGNVLVTGYQAFLKSITDFFNKILGSQKVTDTGLDVLITNVSGLMKEAERAQQQTTQKISLGMSSNANQDYTTEQLYEGLDSTGVTPTFDAHLREMLTGIVEKLHGTFGSYKAALMENSPKTPDEIFAEAIASGVAPFGSNVMSAPFAVSEQEVFVIDQLEATVRAGLDNNPHLTTAVYDELNKVFVEQRDRLKGKMNQDQWEFIFNLPAGTQAKRNHLAQFAAMALGNQEFNQLLKVPTAKVKDNLQSNTPLNVLKRVFFSILEYFNGKITHTIPGQFADAKVQALVKQLVLIENKQAYAAKHANDKTAVTSVEDAMEGFSKAARDRFVKIVESDFFKNNRHAAVRAFSGVTSVIANDRMTVLVEGLKTIRDRHFIGIQGVGASLYNEYLGPRAAMQVLLQMGKLLQGNRKDIIAQTSKFARESFADGAKGMTKATKKAITNVFMRTDLHTLMDNFSLNEIEDMVSITGGSLQTAITTYEGKLSQFARPYRNYFLNQSKYLAHYMATGEVKSPWLMRNAGNIAMMYGTKGSNRLSAAHVEEVTKVLDTLISLYALQYSNKDERIAAAAVMASERKRTDKGNGIELVLKNHKMLVENSKERLFAGNEALMMKGYMPEITDPKISVRSANLEEGLELENLGYIKQPHTLPTDPHDVGAEVKHLYVLKGGGLSPWLSGIINYSGMTAKGTQHHSSMNYRQQRKITQEKRQDINDLFNDNPTLNPAIVRNGNMAPLLNGEGKAVNYQYLMTNKIRDDLMRRDNNFDALLGAFAGSIYDKETATEHNTKAIRALHEEYLADFSKEPASFIWVSAESAEAELRDIYKMLPKGTRDAVRDIWGTNGMWVRTDTLDIMFGYRKLEVFTEMFEKNVEDRNAYEKLITYFGEHILRTRGTKKAAAKVRTAGRIWAAGVSEVKDIFVQKTGFVLLGNFGSNVTLLKLHGVPWKDMLRDHYVGYKGVESYLKDTDRLANLQQQLNTGYVKGNVDEIHQEIARIKDSMERNPVRELIEGGLMPAIVEDLAAEEDTYSYKTEAAEYLEKYTSKINPHIRNVARTAYMAHDTPLYGAMSHLTQVSDFVARYVLYQHLTNRKKNPLDSVAAIKEATDSFILYDVPMHRKIQYMDDMGLFYFTKYFLRIQRILLARTKENPGRVMSLLLMDQYMDWIPSVMESSAWAHAGNNPLHLGPLEIFGALPQIAVPNAAMSVFKF